MNFYRAFLFVVYKKRKYKKLVIPIGFLITEGAIALILIWALFGVTDSFHFLAYNLESSPVVAIKGIHSDNYFKPYGDLTPPVSGRFLIKKQFSVKALSYSFSLICSFIGIFLSSLWINRFFRENNLNIKWWIWPPLCLGAHILFLFLANF